MLHSSEVRWFYHTALLDDTVAWFCAGRALELEQRVDSYLLFPGCETVGLKVRQGENFEVKALRGTPEIVHYTTHVSGQSDCWVKWSYSKPPVASWIEAILREGSGWVSVEKARRLRKFSLDSSSLQELSGDTRPTQGCNVELTRLRVHNEEWWSFAFEAFGAADQVRSHLQTVADYFFTNHAPIHTFEVSDSYAYPTWLNHL